MSKRGNHDGKAAYREKKRNVKTPELKKVNFEVTENWSMECPHCLTDQTAPFNKENPMEPMEVTCSNCFGEFILTYERNN